MAIRPWYSLCGLLSGSWVSAQSLVKSGVCFAGFFILALPTHPTARKPPRSRHSVAASLRGRSSNVTGVQTCALPISKTPTKPPLRGRFSTGESDIRRLRPRDFLCGVGGFSPPSASRAYAGCFSGGIGSIMAMRPWCNFCAVLLRRYRVNNGHGAVV